jgi:hypothetical protein
VGRQENDTRASAVSRRTFQPFQRSSSADASAMTS